MKGSSYLFVIFAETTGIFPCFWLIQSTTCGRLIAPFIGLFVFAQSGVVDRYPRVITRLRIARRGRGERGRCGGI